MAEEQKSIGTRGGRPLRVLLVDDNPSLQEALASILQDAGCEVRSAPDGAEAVAMAQEWAPDIAFVDVHMPRLDGYEVAKLLRGRFARGTLKLVLMSAVTIDAKLAQDARQAGFDACIDKLAGPEVWLGHLQGAGAP